MLISWIKAKLSIPTRKVSLAAWKLGGLPGMCWPCSPSAPGRPSGKHHGRPLPSSSGTTWPRCEAVLADTTSSLVSTVPTATWQFGVAALWAPLQCEQLCVTMDNINYKCFLEPEPEAGLVAALCLPWCGLCWTEEPFWSVLPSALSLALAEAQVKYQKYGYTEELLGI